MDCIQAFEKYILFYNSKLSINFNENILESYEGCFTFEQIFSRNQIVFPFIFNEIMERENNIIPQIDIISLNNYIQNNFDQKNIQKYIIPMIYIEKLPIEILSKFFVRMYTEESLFYYSLNQSLMKKENTYDIFVKVLYKGLYIGSLHNSEDEILYRGSKISKNEIDNIRKQFEEWKKNKNNKLPKFLLYSRTFLSFTKEKAKIYNFLKNVNESCYRVVFYLKNNDSIYNKYSSNADIENLSVIKNEKEVLFFPYTAFCLKNIYKGEYDNEFWFYVELDYLGQYEYIFEEFKEDKDFQSDVFNSIYFYLNSYGNEVINRGLLPLNDNNNKSEIDNEIKIKRRYGDQFSSGVDKENSSNSKDIIYIKRLSKAPANNFYLSEFLYELKDLNKKLITITFTFTSGSRFQIRCNPFITVSKMISYILESLNGKTKLSIDELKKELIFLYNGEILNIFDSKTIKEKKIVNGAHITVINSKYVVFHQ